MKGETQVVAPVQPVPPHCAYCAAPVETVVDVGATDVAELVFETDVEVALAVVFTEVVEEPPELEPEQLKTEGPGIV